MVERSASLARIDAGAVLQPNEVPAASQLCKRGILLLRAPCDEVPPGTPTSVFTPLFSLPACLPAFFLSLPLSLTPTPPSAPSLPPLPITPSSQRFSLHLPLLCSTSRPAPLFLRPSLRPVIHPLLRTTLTDVTSYTTLLPLSTPMVSSRTASRIRT